MQILASFITRRIYFSLRIISRIFSLSQHGTMRNFLLLFFLVFSTQIIAQEEMIYDFPTQMPKFPGGGPALDHFVKDNMQYPESARANGEQGKVYVMFTVEKDGSLTDIQVKKGVSEALNNEAKRIVGLMPNWDPGKNRGKVVRTRYTLPIVFTL